MAYRRTPPLSFFAIGLLLAASVLSGCAADDTAEPMAALHPTLVAGRCDTAPVGEMPISVHGTQAFVPLTINNLRLRMLLDTGDFATALTPDAVARLGLRPAAVPAVEMTGIGGVYDAPVVQAENVQYLSRSVRDLPFAVLPAAEMTPDEGADGLFGADFLSGYEVELDFAAGRMRFYDQPAGCGAVGPDWAGQAARLRAVNAGRNLLLVPVTINGVELNALLDTGSQDTSITHSAALALGVTEAALARDEAIEELGIGATTMRMHHFASITVGGVTVRNPVLTVEGGASALQSAAITASLAALPVPHKGVDVILGANFLFKRKIWLGYHHDVVFVQ